MECITEDFDGFRRGNCVDCPHVCRLHDEAWSCGTSAPQLQSIQRGVCPYRYGIEQHHDRHGSAIIDGITLARRISSLL